jgi:hypothetical protein
MNPQASQGNNSAANSQDDPLTNAANNANANFWYDDAGSSVVPCNSVPPPTVVSPDKKHWVEVSLVDQDGNPVADANYEITVPGGSTITGTLNSKGAARVEGIDPGNCKITFPDYDQDGCKPL